MKNYDFVLTPGYCFFNGVGIIGQKGCEIQFLIENPENNLLKERLERAFLNHLDYVTRQSDCTEDFKGKAKITFTPGTENDLKKIITNLYQYEENDDENFDERVINPWKSKEQEKYKAKEDNAAAVVLLDTLLRDAQQKGVTDIHIENKTVMFREQGKLKYQIRLQQDKFNELIQRIKLLAEMNLVENRRCQDGQFVVDVNKKRLFIRASVVPVIGNDYDAGSESVVLRLLDVSRLPLNLRGLGFDDRQLESILSLIKNENGLILVCGPTGSGKSTTVASLLTELVKQSDCGKKIISLEDPPEYVVSGVTQIKVDEEHGNNFETVLNHIFRQDPDVLMIGEIRDRESAMAALRGSLTGHLVLATVHSSSAALSLMRLENLGLNRKIIASVLKGVIVQQLGYVGNEPLLMADVSIPKENFDSRVTDKASESELDDLFSHCVNSASTVKKTIDLMKQKSLMQHDVEFCDFDAVENPESRNYEIDGYEISHRRKKRRTSILPVFGTNPGIENSAVSGD